MKSVLDANKRKTLSFHGAIETYDTDAHTITFDVKGAADVLAGEDDFDDERHAAIGFLNDDLPLFVDVGRKTHPVYAFADGELLLVHKAFASWAGSLAKPATKTSKTATKTKPQAVGPKKIVPGPKTVDWPTDAVVAFELGTEGEDFLWFGYNGVKPKKNHEALLRYVRPQGHRERFAVGSKWDAKAAMKMDRGTGVWLDFSIYDGRTPVVTPRIKALLESVQPKGLEFLPVRATVGRETADVFLVNVTLAVACLDVAASGLPTPYLTHPYRQQSPDELVLVPKNIPTEPCFFRLSEYPELILATRAMVDVFRREPPSGLEFVELARSRYKSL